MDELLSHCIREISFDGDLGCDVSRLNSFISSFYAKSDQNLDDAFRAYVWALVAAQPNVRVGLVPEGVSTDVAVAPRPGKGKDSQKEPDVPRLEIIEEASATPLPALLAKYGDKLRIAVDETTAFKTITGSHIRPPKLSGMVYTALQLVCRGRELGISVAQLGKSTGYDQKTCHYLCQQLLTLDLVVKLPKPGVGTNFVVHKYFYDHSPLWQRLHAEEQDPLLGIVGQEDESDGSDGDGPSGGNTVKFRVMDEIDWSSDALFRARLVMVLKSCPGSEIESNKLLRPVGVEGDKGLRRFFNHRIEALIEEGVIERFERANLKRPGSSKTFVRLLAATPVPDAPHPPPSEHLPEQVSDVYEHPQPDQMPCGNETLQRQMISLLEAAGTTGLTLRDIMERLGDYDRRTLELLLYRLEKTPPPEHLADLGIVMTLENFGRERRYRYYTSGAYRVVAAKENLAAPVADGPAPEYAPVDASDFFADEDALATYLRSFASAKVATRNAAKKTKTGRAGGTNPLDATGRPLVGRPRKEWSGGVSIKPSVSKQINPVRLPNAGGKSKRKRTAKDADTEDEEDEPPAKKKRGPAPKKKKVAEDDDEEDDVDELMVEDAPVKKRGRASKRKSGALAMTSGDEAQEATDDARPSKAKKGKAKAEAKAKAKTKSKKGKEKEVVEDEQDDVTAVDQPIAVSVVEAAPADEVEQATTVLAPTASITDNVAHTVDDDQLIAEAASASQLTVIPEKDEDPVPGSSSKAGTKRPLASSDAGDPGSKPKRPRKNDTKVRHAVEISKLRRENEFIKLAEKHGVVVASSFKFDPLYVELVKEMIAHGDPVSSQLGVAPDGRTVNKTLDSLVAKGLIKVIDAVDMAHGGISTKTKVYHLPQLAQEHVNRALAELGNGIVVPVLAPAVRPRNKPNTLVNLGIDNSLKGRSSVKNPALVTQLLAAEGHAARSAFLTEKQTMWQLYGFLCGKLARARELHLYTLSQLASDSPLSKHIVSHDDRIVTLGYFFHELPLGTYCSLIPATSYDERLETALRTVDGMNMLVQHLPQELAVPLQVGKARARAKMHELLTLLTQLDLVVPLVASTAETPEFPCAHPNGVYPSAYDRAGPDDVNKTDIYYKFNTAAPLYHYGCSQGPPPFVGYRSLLSADVSLAYWRDLKALSSTSDFLGDYGNNDPPPLVSRATDHLVRDVKRQSCWVDYYVMSWYQKEYLRNQLDPHTGATPLDDPDPEKARFVQLCYISCVPINFAQAFYIHEAELWKEAKTRYRRIAAVESAAAPTDAAGLKLPRISKARKRREDDWATVLRDVHPNPPDDALAQTLELLKTRFMETALTKRKLEIELRIAVDAHRQKTIMRKKQPETRPLAVPLIPQQLVDSTPVSELVEMVRAKTEALGLTKRRPVPKSKKRKLKKSEELDAGEAQDPVNDDGRIRRRRFAWNAQFDELARDVGAVLRVRCTGTRMDWATVEQIFPGISRVAVRTRIINLREAPGGESYALRLDEAWRTLWMAHRGTDELPDDNPKSTNDFPIIDHVEFLRKYVDKQSLRLGVNLAGVPDASDATIQPLLEDVALFSQMWSIEEKPRPTPAMKESIWGGISDELREREGLKEAFILDTFFTSSTEYPRDDMPEVVQSALKMMLSTPEERFNEDLGADMLKKFGDEATTTAAVALLNRNVLAQTVHDVKKLHPGRTLKIADAHHATLGGWLSAEMALDAVAIDDVVDEDTGWQDWSPLATDGDTAALLRMLVNDEIEMDVDLAQYAAAREALDWNSRKVDDGQIEGIVSWRFKGRRFMPETPEQEDLDTVDVHVEAATELQHGQTSATSGACCSLSTVNGYVDCVACIQASITSKLAAAASEDARHHLIAVLSAVEAADWRGVTRGQLEQHLLALHGMSSDRIWETVRVLCQPSIPLLLWTGYDNARVVHSALSARWTVALGHEPGADKSIVDRRLPRRWLDIRGWVIEDDWNAAVRAVTSVVQQRPGVPTADLRVKLAQYFDRQELNEILEYMLSQGALKRVAVGEVPKSSFEVDAFDEKKVFWFTARKKAWYRLAAETAPA